jgi:hypothetical protein
MYHRFVMLKISSVLLIRHLKTRDVKLSLYVLKKMFVSNGVLKKTDFEDAQF